MSTVAKTDIARAAEAATASRADSPHVEDVQGQLRHTAMAKVVGCVIRFWHPRQPCKPRA